MNETLHNLLDDIWYGRHPARWCLLPLSWLYRGIAALRASPYNLLGRFSDAGAASPVTTKTRHVEPQHRNFGEFKVPSLRHVALTAPYFHDGRAPTLELAVETMARVQLGRELAAADIGADETPGPASAVLSFVVRRADTNTVIDNSLVSGETIDLFALCGFNCPVTIEAVTSVSPIESVTLVLTGATSQNRTDNSNPYTIPGNAGMILNNGAHSLTATPFSADNAGGTAGTPLTVAFTVVRGPVINTTAPTTATLGDLYFYDVNASSTAPPLAFSLTQEPPVERGDMTINAGNGQISWTPAVPNPDNPNPTVSYSNAVTVRVTDSQGRFT